MYIYICIYIYIYMCVHIVWIYIYLHMHTHIHVLSNMVIYICAGVTHIVSGLGALSDELVELQNVCDLCPPCVCTGTYLCIFT